MNQQKFPYPLKTTVEELSFVFDISSTVWVNDLIQSLHNIAIINIIPINLLFTEWFYSFVIKFASFCVLVTASFSVACCGRFCCCLIPLDNPNGRERDKLFLSESFKRYDHSHIINLCDFRQNLHFFSSQKIVHSTFSFSGLEHFKTFRLGPAMPIFAILWIGAVRYSIVSAPNFLANLVWVTQIAIKQAICFLLSFLYNTDKDNCWESD